MPSSEVRLVWAFDDFAGGKKENKQSRGGVRRAGERDFCTGFVDVNTRTGWIQWLPFSHLTSAFYIACWDDEQCTNRNDCEREGVY